MSNILDISKLTERFGARDWRATISKEDQEKKHGKEMPRDCIGTYSVPGHCILFVEIEDIDRKSTGCVIFYSYT